MGGKFSYVTPCLAANRIPPPTGYCRRINPGSCSSSICLQRARRGDSHRAGLEATACGKYTARTTFWGSAYSPAECLPRSGRWILHFEVLSGRTSAQSPFSAARERIRRNPPGAFHTSCGSGTGIETRHIRLRGSLLIGPSQFRSGHASPELVLRCLRPSALGNRLFLPP